VLDPSVGDAHARLPEPGEVLARAMAVVTDRQHDLQAAEAARIVALLDAWRVTDADARAADEPTSRDRYVAKGFLMAASHVLRISQRGTAHLFDTAEAIRAWLPACWSVFTSGACGWRLVDIAHQQGQGLEGEALSAYDREAARLLAGTAVSSDLKQRLHRLRERLQADTATTRTKAASADRHTTIAPLPDGQATLAMTGPAHLLAAIEDGVTKQAIRLHGEPGEDRCFGALKFDVMVDLLLHGLQQDAPTDPCRVGSTPARRAVVPTVLLTLPLLTLLGCGSEQPTLAGYGPIDLDTARMLAGMADSWTRIFTDPVTGDLAAIDKDARRIPQALKSWLWARDETCRAPGCNRPAPRCDLDHTERYEHRGPTEPGNLVCYCRGHHGAKDDGCWEVAHLPGDRLRWRSRWGTEVVTEPAHRSSPSPSP
jgi:Domain of unknown function (DUF222)